MSDRMRLFQDNDDLKRRLQEKQNIFDLAEFIIRRLQAELDSKEREGMYTNTILPAGYD